jgi:hypothetical protein
VIRSSYGGSVIQTVNAKPKPKLQATAASLKGRIELTETDKLEGAYRLRAAVWYMTPCHMVYTSVSKALCCFETLVFSYSVMR